MTGETAPADRWALALRDNRRKVVEEVCRPGAIGWRPRVGDKAGSAGPAGGIGRRPTSEVWLGEADADPDEVETENV